MHLRLDALRKEELLASTELQRNRRLAPLGKMDQWLSNAVVLRDGRIAAAEAAAPDPDEQAVIQQVVRTEPLRVSLDLNAETCLSPHTGRESHRNPI